MARFKMILLGSQRIEINSKTTNEKKLSWFIDEIKKYELKWGTLWNWIFYL